MKCGVRPQLSGFFMKCGCSSRINEWSRPGKCQITSKFRVLFSVYLTRPERATRGAASSSSDPLSALAPACQYPDFGQIHVPNKLRRQSDLVRDSHQYA